MCIHTVLTCECSESCLSTIFLTTLLIDRITKGYNDLCVCVSVCPCENRDWVILGYCSSVAIIYFVFWVSLSLSWNSLSKVGPKDLSVSPSPMLDIHVSTVWLLYLGSGYHTQVLLLVWWALCPLRYPQSPHIAIFDWIFSESRSH